MYYMRINKNLVHQVGDQTKVILRCTVNQPSRFRSEEYRFLECGAVTCYRNLKMEAEGSSAKYTASRIRKQYSP
jgi:hypothetical protein